MYAHVCVCVFAHTHDCANFPEHVAINTSSSNDFIVTQLLDIVPYSTVPFNIALFQLG